MRFVENRNQFDVAFSVIRTERAYQGEYVVYPRVVEQTLATKNKHMEDNVNVKAIDIRYVSNPKQGKTVIIGGI